MEKKVFSVSSVSQPIFSKIFQKLTLSLHCMQVQLELLIIFLFLRSGEHKGRSQNFCYKDDLLNVNVLLFITMHLFWEAIFVGEEEPYDNE